MRIGRQLQTPIFLCEYRDDPDHKEYRHYAGGVKGGSKKKLFAGGQHC